MLLDERWPQGPVRLVLSHTHCDHIDGSMLREGICSVHEADQLVGSRIARVAVFTPASTAGSANEEIPSVC